MGFWKQKRARAEARELDIEKAQRAHLQAIQEQLAVTQQSGPIVSMASRFAVRREMNHFGESLTLSFTPRSNNAHS